MVVVPVLGGVAVIALLLGILAGVVGGYMWKKKKKNGKIYVVTRLCVLCLQLQFHHKGLIFGCCYQYRICRH